jgi:iron complex transport system substrate-binding protein
MEFTFPMKRFLLLLLLISVLGGCTAPSPIPTPSQSSTQTAVPISTAHTDENASPAHAELRYAKAFKVEYHDNYKVLTLLKPWRDAETTFTYILVQRGTPVPTNIGDAQVIEIPVQSAAALATTHLAYLNTLGDLDTLVAIGNAQYVNTPGVVERLENGRINAVGNGPDVNIESLLELNPEMITTLALGSSSKDDYQQLMQKGFKVVIFSDFMEESPLGRAEWIKFMALFYNQEAQAEQIFAGIEERYLKMQTLAASVSDRPNVLLGFEINGKWNMPGGKSYQAAYVKDAGGNYLWSDDITSGRIPLSFEAVLEKGVEADFWFDQSVGWLSDQDVLAADTRYDSFRAFQQQQVYNNNARLNPTGGNDYNESGLMNPDVILADLISILHPDLLPEHELVYYRPMHGGGN